MGLLLRSGRIFHRNAAVGDHKRCEYRCLLKSYLIVLMTTPAKVAHDTSAAYYHAFWEWFSQHERLVGQVVKAYARAGADQKTTVLSLR